jgi:hypothetical protein
MKKASKDLEAAFWDGIKQDRNMGKHSRRLMKVLAANEGDVKKTVAQLVMAPKIQTGLKWAKENNVLWRSLEENDGPLEWLP